MIPVQRRGYAALALLALAIPPAAWAAESTVFVTDELRLGLYQGEETTGRPIRMLTSGDQLQILERALRTIRVRTEDGDEGWVKTGYVVTQTPARRRIEPLQADNEQLSDSLKALSADNEAMGQRLTQLSAQLEQAQQGTIRLPEVESKLATLQQALASQGSSVHLNWLYATALLAFVCGCWAGYYWLDRRVRKRFGGLRVY